jgi:hypothetical protein
LEGQFVFSRNRLKWGVLACLIVLTAAAFFQLGWPHPFQMNEALYFVETGSAVSAVAICIALVATI